MVKNASAGEKAGWFNGRTPLFSQKDLLRLVGPLLIEQFLAVTVVLFLSVFPVVT